MTLRLLALSILAIIFIPQPLVVIALVVLLNYLVIFQLLGLYSAFDYQPLTLLFPMKKGSKKAGLNKMIQLVMSMITAVSYTHLDVYKRQGECNDLSQCICCSRIG